MILEQWSDKREVMRHTAPQRKNIQSRANSRCTGLEARECLVYSTCNYNKGIKKWNWEGRNAERW